MDKRVWLVEAKQYGVWYPCWWDVYYRRKDADKQAKALRDQGYLDRQGHRVVEYVRKNK